MSMEEAHNSEPLAQEVESTPASTPQDTSFVSSNQQNSATPSSNPSHDVSELEKSSQRRSIVWEHFTKMKVNGEDKAQCNACKKYLCGASKNGTKHLHLHMKSCPRRKMTDIRQKILTGKLKGELTSQAFDQQVARKDLAEMIILHEYPLSMVDHAGFRKYSSSLQPLFKCPSRNTLKSDITSIYDQEKLKMLKILEKNDSRVAITSDMWTSSNQKKGFMAITVHFIDSSWTLHGHILRYEHFYITFMCEIFLIMLSDFFLIMNCYI